ncbi:MAG: hypothetical protein A3G41_05780 [Elusimicrobia bacterium RIFCSPLOWO2_12_FULL_59_9]|nr:MAG: hypothetical protein A3G41_05780 [Elusimicrobia bacterium RIFCSPLOWO2_12_FULL_59_9]
MKNAVISLGHACNSRCVFCMDGYRLPELKRKMDVEKIRVELEHFHGLGCRRAVFLGGEPTIFPWLGDLVRHARALGYASVEVSTNGLRCGDREYVRQLLEAGVSRVTISIHSHLAGIEEELTGVPGGLKRKLEGLRVLAEFRRQGFIEEGIYLNPVLARSNYRHVPAYVNYFEQSGVDHIHFNLIGGSIYTWPLGQDLKDSGLVPAYAEIMPYLVRALLPSRRKSQVSLRFENIPPCVFPWGKMSRSVLEKIIERHTKEVESHSWLSIIGRRFEWDRFVREEFCVKGEVCRQCEYRDRCSGVLKSYVSVYGFRELSPIHMDVPRAL